MSAPSPADTTRAHALLRLGELVEAPGQGPARIGCAMVHLRNVRHVRTLIGDAGLQEYLAALRDKLVSVTRDGDRLIECSYDHFVLLLPDIMNTGHLRLVAQKLDLLLRNPIVVGDQMVASDFALGLAMLPDDAEDARQLLERAEVALLAAEQAGLTHCLFDPAQLSEMTQSWELDRELREAIAGNSLMTYYQPQVCLHDGSLHGVEALARWNHPGKGFISPGEFIPAAEKSGLITRLTDVIVKQVMQDFARLTALGIPMVSMNLSALDLEDPELAARIQQQLAIWGVSGEQLTFEITESCILQGSDITRRQLDKLRQLGCALSIDDFGTGYSSLSNFRTVPASEIKIDGSFVDGIEANSTNRDIVAIALELARRFDLKAVAEGVETEEGAKTLREMGCRIGQGYLYARPLALTQLEAWVRERTPGENN